MTAPGERSPTIGLALVWVSAAAALVSVFAALTGGFRFDIGVLPVSVHNPTRPALLAIVCGVLGLRLARLADKTSLARFNPLILRGAPFIAVAFACLIGLTMYLRGAHIAGGADSSGYISQSRLWQRAALTGETPLAHDLKFVNGQYVFTELGYQPGPTYGTTVPGYPAGLPMLMALAAQAAGAGAIYTVVPLCAAGTIIVAFLLGRRIGGTDTGLIAAAATGAAPIFLFQGMQPMSDVPAAFWWSLAVLLFTFEHRLPLFAGACAAAVACAIRPNLFAMMPVLVALLMSWTNSWRERFIRIAVVAPPLVAAFAALLAFNRALFGAATTSGYGPTSSLFAIEHVWPNLLHYPRWLFATHSPMVLLALMGPIVLRHGLCDPLIDRRLAVRIAWSGLVFWCALLGFYLLYLVFDDWAYLRFLLPAFPWALTLFALTLTALVRQAPAALRGIALILVFVTIASWGVGRSRGLGAFTLVHSEQRYLDVAAFVRERPPNRVVVALQHSGSLAYYTQVPLLRWDWIEPAEIDRAIGELTGRGREVYAVLEDWEEQQFRARFPKARVIDDLARPLFETGLPLGIKVRVYRLTATTGAGEATTVSWRQPPAPRTPSTPEARDRAAYLATPRPGSGAAAKNSAARHSPSTFVPGT